MATKRCVTNPALPRYSEKRGWHGGAKKVLFTLTDPNVPSWMAVRPAQNMRSMGPGVHIRVATRAEAEKHWQHPLHPGWKVKC